MSWSEQSPSRASYSSVHNDIAVKKDHFQLNGDAEHTEEEKKTQNIAFETNEMETMTAKATFRVYI